MTHQFGHRSGVAVRKWAGGKRVGEVGRVSAEFGHAVAVAAVAAGIGALVAALAAVAHAGGGDGGASNGTRGSCSVGVCAAR